MDADRVRAALVARLDASAATDREFRARFADGGDDPPGADGLPAVESHLRSLDDPTERVAAALVGASLVRSRFVDRAVGFFVGRADCGAADTCREYGDAVDDRLEIGLDRLADMDADGTAARDAAVGAVEAVYEGYVDGLGAMGVNPKPVCRSWLHPGGVRGPATVPPRRPR